MFLKFLLWLISKLSDSQLYALRHNSLICGPFVTELNETVTNHDIELARLHSQIIDLESELDSLRDSPAPVPEPLTEIFSRMNYEVYEYFERTVSNTSVASSTTDLEAGFKLGVQHVLAKLRNGYVTPRSL